MAAQPFVVKVACPFVATNNNNEDGYMIFTVNADQDVNTISSQHVSTVSLQPFGWRRTLSYRVELVRRETLSRMGCAASVSAKVQHVGASQNLRCRNRVQ